MSDFLFREDLYSLGYVFLELVFGAFCASKAKRPDQNALKRLLEDIFKGDFRAFKEYCLTEPEWESAIEVLDSQKGSGWGLATALLNARGATGSNFGRGGGGGDGNGSGGYLDAEDREGEESVGVSMVSTRAVLSLPYFTDKDN